MKQIKLLLIIFTLVCGMGALVAFKSHKKLKNDNKENQDNGFAVVELFTSEGCSSCPAADELVAKVQQESKDKSIYILAFHVDYWNRLGWKDAFSSADYSQRQNQYAKWLKLESVYTPQIVVNGSTEFVGSDNAKLQNAIKNNLQTTEKTKLFLDDLKTVANQINLGYRVENLPQNALLLLAIVQKQALTKVKAGENNGRTLTHVQIVRSFKSIPLNKNSGVAEIDLPKGIDIQGLEIIAFLQNPLNGNIIAATKSGLAN